MSVDASKQADDRASRAALKEQRAQLAEAKRLEKAAARAAKKAFQKEMKQAAAVPRPPIPEPAPESLAAAPLAMKVNAQPNATTDQKHSRTVDAVPEPSADAASSSSAAATTAAAAAPALLTPLTPTYDNDGTDGGAATDKTELGTRTAEDDDDPFPLAQKRSRLSEDQKSAIRKADVQARAALAVAKAALDAAKGPSAAETAGGDSDGTTATAALNRSAFEGTASEGTTFSTLLKAADGESVAYPDRDESVAAASVANDGEEKKVKEKISPEEKERRANVRAARVKNVARPAQLAPERNRIVSSEAMNTRLKIAVNERGFRELAYPFRTGKIDFIDPETGKIKTGKIDPATIKHCKNEAVPLGLPPVTSCRITAKAALAASVFVDAAVGDMIRKSAYVYSAVTGHVKGRLPSLMPGISLFQTSRMEFGRPTPNLTAACMSSKPVIPAVKPTKAQINAQKDGETDHKKKVAAKTAAVGRRKLIHAHKTYKGLIAASLYLNLPFDEELRGKFDSIEALLNDPFTMQPPEGCTCPVTTAAVASATTEARATGRIHNTNCSCYSSASLVKLRPISGAAKALAEYKPSEKTLDNYIFNKTVKAQQSSSDDDDDDSDSDSDSRGTKMMPIPMKRIDALLLQNGVEFYDDSVMSHVRTVYFKLLDGTDPHSLISLAYSHWLLRCKRVKGEFIHVPMMQEKDVQAAAQLLGLKVHGDLFEVFDTEDFDFKPTNKKNKKRKEPEPPAAASSSSSSSAAAADDDDDKTVASDDSHGSEDDTSVLEPEASEDEDGNIRGEEETEKEKPAQKKPKRSAAPSK